MNRDTNSFSRLKEIESELDSLKDYKKQTTKEEQQPVYRKPPSPNPNTLFLKNINESCMRMENELIQISNSLRKLVRLFKATMEGKSPEDLEGMEMEDKVNRLMQQNAELMRKLNTMRYNTPMNTDYNFDMLNTNAPNPFAKPQYSDI